MKHYIPLDLDLTDRLLMRHVINHPHLTHDELAARVGLTADSTRRWLGRLVTRGLVVSETTYRVVDNQHREVA